MEAVTVGLAKTVVDIVSANERWQIGYTFRGLAAKMSNVSLMHKKRSRTAHDFV